MLRDFAAAGHQVLVFTCHEHMLRMFQSLKVPAARLPDAREAEHAAVVFEEPAKERPKRARKAPAAPRRRPPASSRRSCRKNAVRRPDRGKSGEDAPWDEAAEADFEDADDEVGRGLRRQP